MRINFIRRTHVLILFALLLFTVQFAAAQAPAAKQFAARVDEYIKAAASFDQFSGSVLIARSGTPVFSKGYGMANYELNVANTPRTVFRIASLTKQFTGVAIMQLQERGKLNVNDVICKYVEDCPAAWQPITIRQLLTHTSGIPNYSSLPDWDEKLSFQPYTQAEFMKLFRDLPLQFAPGENHKYSNSGYYLLGLIIEKVSGRSYAEFVKENIFVPLGMKNTGLYDWRPLTPNMATGYYWSLNSYVNAPYYGMASTNAEGGMISTTGDLLLWDQALYTEKLASNGSLKEIFTPYKNDYAYGWRIGKKFEKPIIHHSGSINGYSSYIMRFPAERATIIILSNSDETSATKVANDLAAIVFGETYKLPVPQIKNVIADAIIKKDLGSAIRYYRELKKTKPDAYDFRESMLDDLGWDLIENKRPQDAIEIFKLNIEYFPKSGGAYDSLGEVYFLEKNYDLALASFKKFQELDPPNDHAKEMIGKIEEAMKKGQ